MNEKKECILNGHKKSLFWQMVRGICILAVVMIHCPGGNYFSAVDSKVWIVFRQLINFPVALFFFMAGYFVNIDKVNEDYFHFLTNRGTRLVIPYIVWSGVYLVIEVIKSRSVPLSRIVYCIFTGDAAIQLYYIVVLLQLTLLTPLIIRIKKGRWLYLITPIYYIICYISNFLTGRNSKIWSVLFPAWIIYYILGMDSRKHVFDNVLNKFSGWKVGGALFLSILEAYILNAFGYNYEFVTGQINFSNCLYCCALSFALLKYFQENTTVKMNNVAIKIGNMSYGIFYLHMLVLMIIRKLFSFTIFFKSWVIAFLICFFLTVSITCFIIEFLRKIASKYECNNFLRFIGL